MSDTVTLSLSRPRWYTSTYWIAVPRQLHAHLTLCLSHRPTSSWDMVKPDLKKRLNNKLIQDEHMSSSLCYGVTLTQLGLGRGTTGSRNGRTATCNLPCGVATDGPRSIGNLCGLLVVHKPPSNNSAKATAPQTVSLCSPASLAVMKLLYLANTTRHEFVHPQCAKISKTTTTMRRAMCRSFSTGRLLNLKEVAVATACNPCASVAADQT